MKKGMFWVGGIILFGIIIVVVLIFTLKKSTFEVSFISEGKEILDSIIVKENGTLEEPKSPSKEGYEFVGWYSNGEKFDFSTKITDDITLEAKWEKIEESKTEVDKKTVFTLSKTKVTLSVGKSIKINVTTDSDKKTYWKSSNERIATVKNGKITAKSVGKATVTVTIDGISKTISVTVVKEAKSTSKTSNTTQKVENTSTAKADIVGWDLEEITGSDVGQAILYLTKNGEKVSGTCTIITKTGETVDNFSISANGYSTNTGFIKNVINIKIN